MLGSSVDGTRIIRRRSPDGPLEAGVLQPLREGKPIDGELVSLTPRTDVPFLFDVKTELPDRHAALRARARAEKPDGPAQVASEAYRKGWDAVWGNRRRDRSVN